MADYKREVQLIRDNLDALSSLVELLLPTWSKKFLIPYPQGCEQLVLYYSEGRPEKNALHKFCLAPLNWENNFVSPLQYWLLGYEANLPPASKAFTSSQLDTFIRKGLRIIHDFVVTTNYMAKNSDKLLPDKPNSTLSEKKSLINKRKEIEEEIYKFNARLIGCAEDSLFPFIAISESAKILSEELKKMLNFLKMQCHL